MISIYAKGGARARGVGAREELNIKQRSIVCPANLQPAKPGGIKISSFNWQLAYQTLQFAPSIVPGLYRKSSVAVHWRRSSCNGSNCGPSDVIQRCITMPSTIRRPYFQCQLASAAWTA